MEIKATFNGTDAQAVEFLRQRGPRVIETMTRRLNILMIKLQAHIVEDKLQGQVLHHRSGKLAGSIRVIPPSAEGAALTAGVEGAGGPAWYGRIHEYGGTFHYARLNRRTGLTRQVTMTFPERSFMRSSLFDMEEMIQQSSQAALNEAMQP